MLTARDAGHSTTRLNLSCEIESLNETASSRCHSNARGAGVEHRGVLISPLTFSSIYRLLLLNIILLRFFFFFFSQRDPRLLIPQINPGTGGG